MMNILIAGDSKVYPGLEALVYSTMLHNKNVIWHVFTMDVDIDLGNGTGVRYVGISEEKCEWLRKVVKFMDHNSDLIRYDVYDTYMKHLDESVNRTTNFTPFAALRLIADEVLDVDECLYFDADIIVQDSLLDMYNKYTNMDIDYAAYVLPEACDYFGEMISAVLVLNLWHIRRSGFLKNARRLYNTNIYKYPDQMALYGAGEPEHLPETYNYMYNHKLAPYKPAVLHFSNENWNKLYTVSPGEFYRFYPEHLYIKEGLDLIKTVH